MEAPAYGRLFGYGVWRAPVLMDGGHPAIWAVDSFGVVRKVRTLKPGDDEQVLGDRLWAWLLEHHPERKLALVREPTPELVRDPISRRMVDARLLTDPRSPLAKQRYLARLASLAAGRPRRFRGDT